MTNLFLGYDFMGFVDGTYRCPLADDPKYKNWIRQDGLLLFAIQIVVIGPMGPLVSRYRNVEEVWNKLKTTYICQQIQYSDGWSD